MVENYEEREIQRLLKNIEAVYSGKPWHGDNLLSYLNKLDAIKASIRPAKLSHNIAEILLHMQAWQRFVVEHLNGNTDYEVWDTDLNWVSVQTLTDAQWQNILNDYQSAQQELLSTIQQKAQAMLNEKVGSRPYNFRVLLHGIIQHDVYHLGQISILCKLIL